MALITLLTDFGTADSYVGEVKGVLASQAPGAVVVDVTHDVTPADIRSAQYVLSRTWPRFPAGSIHLVVVDPGVGTARRALAAQAGGHYFVAPDNGLLSGIAATGRFVSLPIPSDAAPTFHARDVFAIAAARLATGTPLEQLGSAVTDPYLSPLPTPRLDGVALVGQVIYVDRFGTLVTNIPGSQVEPGVRIRVDEVDVGPLRRTYSDVERGQLVAYVGSNGEVEVAAREGSAVRLLGVGVGATVRA